LPRWLWTGGIVEYHLAIPPIVAAERLKAAVKPYGFLRRLSPWPGGLLGQVDGLRFRLTTRIPLVRNSFDSILEGQIDETPSGARLLGTFRMHKFVVPFMVLWFGLAMLISIPATISVLTAPETWSPGPPPAFLPLIFPLLGLLVVAVGRWVATWQERRLVAQLDEIIGVNPNGTEPSSQGRLN